MAIQVIDSPKRCPRCFKRMVYEIGQDDSTGAGDMRATHVCWSCDYREIDKAWSRPLKTAGEFAVQRERERREGVVIPMRQDVPWPDEVWDD